MSKAQYRESKLLWLYNYLHLKSGFQFSLDQLRSCSEKIFHFHEDKSFRCCAIIFFVYQAFRSHPGEDFHILFFSLSIFWNSGLWIWNFVLLFFLYFFVYFTDSNIWIFVLFVTSIGSWENTNSYSRHALISSVLFIPK